MIRDNIAFPAGTNVLATSPTGSHYTCNPPVTDTDRDYLVLVGDLWQAVGIMAVHGWHSCTGDEGAYDEDESYSYTWYAMRYGKINIIVTDDQEWYNRAVEATAICKKHNILHKQDRIVVFRWIRDGGNEEQGVDERAYNEALSRWPL